MSLFFDLVVSGIVIGLLYGLFANGLSLILATTRVWHFAHALTYIFASFLFWMTYAKDGLGLVFSLVLTFVGAAVLGLLMEYGVYRPLRHRNAASMMNFVASLTMLTLGQSLILLVWGTSSQSIPTPQLFTRHVNVLGLRVGYWDIVVVAVSVVAFLILTWIQLRTRMGLGFRLVGDHSERAASYGIRMDRIAVQVIIIGSCAAVPAAVLIALTNPIQASGGFSLLVTGIIALMIGGAGNLLGTMIGGLGVGLVESVSTLWVPGQWTQFLLFGLLFLFLIWRPQGLVAAARTA